MRSRSPAANFIRDVRSDDVLDRRVYTLRQRRSAIRRAKRGHQPPMIHPGTEIRFISPQIGYGVVATELIPKGTITWALDDLDQILHDDRIERLSPLLEQLVHKYAYVDGKGRHILCWDHARFVNHSCEANCLASGFEFEVAIRDIHPGEQLTDDYGGLNIEAPFTCLCGSPACRGTVHPDDIVHLADRWDAEVAEAFGLLLRVEQPLWALIRNQEQVRDVIDGRQRPVSARVHFHPAGNLKITAT
jgi:hypothetical protein